MILPVKFSPEVQRLLNWFESNGYDAELPKKEAEQYERWNVADNLIRVHRTTMKVIPKLKLKFGYSDASARRDINNARSFWGSMHRADKNYERAVLSDEIKEVLVKCIKAQQFMAYASNVRNLIKILELDKHDPEPVDWDAMEPNEIVAKYEPELLGIKLEPKHKERMEAYLKRFDEDVVLER